ncbi:sporulation membrane protein YtaF [Paenibacillus thermotolerans]|uniref:sporulation membrane protein YtaF n=1 Tax=Paenibacillus thermotolerans TaxID=3027807 RepID=UPI002367E78D|nr:MULTISPECIES: sporulation membrane protein YtaF [unclassified Paenibacillus]
MTAYLSLLALALAVSLDGFGAGVMYGMRKIRIPWTSIAIVALCSGIVLYASMAIGELFVGWLPETAGKSAGAVILIAIGLWAVYQMSTAESRQQVDSREAARPTDPEGAAGPAAADEERTVLLWEIRTLGIIIKIWKTPSAADMDRSGVISASEAVLLGIALSLDSFGAGIGAALVGFPPLLTAVTIALACGVFIAWGAKLGYLFSGYRWMNRLSMLPGCILIVMGIFKLL